MAPIRAFVGHSFNEIDEEVVRKILDYLSNVSEINSNFSWAHAEHAEPKVLAEKVMNLLEGKNLFIGICTKNERVISQKKLKPSWFRRSYLNGEEKSFEWKTSDWIIQEIGLAIGRKLDTILLIEEGLRKPGGLQGNLEYITFDRSSPEKCFNKLLQMISAIFDGEGLSIPTEAEARALPAIIIDPASPPSDEDWATPKPEWTQQRYENAFNYFVFLGDQTKMETIEGSYKSSAYWTEEKNHSAWEAFKEFSRISFGNGGSLVSLKSMCEANAENCEVNVYLARAYSNYEEHRKAGETFEAAAGIAKSKIRQIQILGEAAVSYQKAGDQIQAIVAITKMKSMQTLLGDGEEEVLQAERSLAKLSENQEIQIGTMERLLELNPTDKQIRFDLAYKYGDIENYELAAMHYLRIPHAERSAAALNNLGVAFGHLGLPAKSIETYRQAENLHETLAMSNISNKLIDVGFLPEARLICEAAIKIPEYDKSVDTSIVRLKEIPDEEQKREAAFLSKAKPTSEFYREYGRALIKTMPKDLASRWQGPHCVFDLRIIGKKLTAIGSYEQAAFRLSNPFLVGASSSPTSKPIRRQIELFGDVYGATILGGIIRNIEGEPNKTSTILTSNEDHATVLMFLSDDASELQIFEKKKNNNSTFYTLKKIS